MFDIGDLIDDLNDDNEFEEIPVDLDTFMGRGYLEQTGVTLSYYQKEMIEHMTQIYNYDTLVRLYGEDRAKQMKKRTVREVICMLGKGNITYDNYVWAPDVGYVTPDKLMSRSWEANNDQGTFDAEAFYDEGEDHVWKITTSKGFVFKAGISHEMIVVKNTPHHKGYSISQGEQRLPLPMVEVGDMFKLHVGWQEPNIDIQYDVTEQEARVIGYLIGDGTWTNSKGDQPCLTNATKEVQDDFIDFVTKNGGRIREDVSGKGCRRLWVAGMNDWFRKHGMVKNVGDQKVWNNEWMRMSDKNLAALINGVWATDGWISFQSSGRVNAGLRMCSESIIRGVHIALIRLGIVSSFKPGREAERNHNAVFNLDISNVQMVQKFLAATGDIVGKAGASQKAMSLTSGNRLKNVEWDRIKSIEYVGVEPTCGVRIPVSSRFSTQGIISANSGKDYCAELACAYVVYKLMCLKDPARYFGKPPGDSIDIINVAINAQQAQEVFFRGLKRIITNSPWFQGKINPKMRQIEFEKNITVYSGHSEAEAFEGYNTLMVILDEIAGFEHFQKGEDEDEGRSPAQAIYDMYNASITSRFPDNGKIVLLSFPRGRGDFIAQRYEEVVGEVQKIPMEHTFVLNPELPIDTPGNSFTIEWTLDNIISYKKADVWALRRPSWDVNPTKRIEHYINDFYAEPVKSLGKFAAEPQEAVGGFFDDHQKIDAFANYGNGIDDKNVFYESFQPDEDARYYIHVDLARKHDRCVIAMAHVTGWRQGGMQGAREFMPVIKTDLIRYWTPSRGNQVDFAEVRDYIVSIIHRGFNVKKITFDQWQSDEMIKFFNRMGIESEVLSVGLQHYMDLKLIITEGRGQAPRNEILRRELKQLFITKNGKNVDHPRTKEGSKDISDAVCGAMFNAGALTPKKKIHQFTVLDADDFRNDEPVRNTPKPIIDPPRTEKIPHDVASFLDLL